MKKRSQFLIIGIIIVAFIIINSFGSIVRFATDYMWFNEIGYTETFLTELKAQFSIGIPLFVLLTLFFYLYMKRMKKKYYVESEIIEVGGDKKVNLIIKIVSIVLGFFFTISIVSTLWFEILQYLNAVPFGVTDPVFGHDVSFYVFKLPLINTVVGFIINILFMMIVATILLYGFLGVKKNFKNISGQFEDMSQFNPNQLFDLNLFLNKKFITQIINQVSIIGAIVLLFLGFRFFLQTYDLLYSQVGKVFGAGYTDMLVTLNVYRVMAVISIISAFVFFYGARKRNLVVALSFPAILIMVSIIGTVSSGVVEKFIVEPDQITKEKKYMEYNIKNTQQAYGLNNVEEIEFPVENNLTIADIENNQSVINNVRINDQRPLNQVYNQLQGIRPYYVFNDVDVDRYTIDGEYKQVFLSARELDQTKLNEQAQTWINQYLKYTHGYGIALSPVSEVTSQGQPEMMVKNIPPTTETDFKISKPEIYFGEKTNQYVIVNSDEKEFDYPSGSDNAECLYEGKAGIKLSFMNKILFGLREGSYKLLISNNINADSKIVINRNIIERVQEIASFIYYDPNAYLVVNQEDGKLYWIIEGFTVSERYPYSQPTDKFIENMRVNYVRNSVKVVVDAYDGTTNYYIADEEDPIIKTYSKIFTDLFKPMSEMPKGIKDHVRYSQEYFNIQSDLYRLYHIENPTVFFGREDYWDISKEKYMSGEQPVESNFVMFKLPKEEEAEFLLTVPYSPQGKDNMISLFVARNDGDNYGKLLLYKFPKNKTIPGTSMIEAKIDQDTVISSQLTLWSQKGSGVLRGNTLAIPIENSLIYVEPIYLQADTKSNFPEMKMVVVSYGDKIVMETTLEKALERVFGVSTANQEQNTGDIITGDYENQTVNQLIQQANDVFIKANESQKNGDWAGYGQNLKDLEDVLKQLNLLTNGEVVTDELQPIEGEAANNANGEVMEDEAVTPVIE